ncbi:MAG: sulfurtransferase [Novosphingobium sp.]
MRDPQALVDTDELSAALADPNLCIFDCTTYLDRLPPGSGQPYLAVSGRATFQEAHIPGADFLDLEGEFSDQATALHFMMPDVAQLEAAFGRHGIGMDSRVVLYSIGSMTWATRFWWMLKSLGFDNVAVLDGGFDKWRAEGRPTQRGPAQGYPPAPFKASPRPGWFVNKLDVLDAIGKADTAIVNALSPALHAGLDPSSYGRSGRIPGSLNVYGATLVNNESKTFVTLDEANAAFAAQGITKDKRVICYCGGGISATLDLFLLYQLGYTDLSLYDGSMGEWAKDTSLPIETDG